MANKTLIILFLKISLLALVIIMTFNIYQRYQEEYTKCEHEVETLFNETIRKDMDIRTKELGDLFCLNYTPCLANDSIMIQHPDTIMYLENRGIDANSVSEMAKLDFIIQHYLSMENPVRVERLDSLFHASLSKRRLPVRAAIVYTMGGNPINSHPDPLFYIAAKPLEEVVFGINRDIVFQAFVQIPFSYILKETLAPDLLFLVLWFVALIVLVWLVLGKKWREVDLLPIPDAPLNLIKITDQLLFDQTHGILQYKGDKIELINQRLKLFVLLLEHQGYYVESDWLKESIWPDGSVSKDALSSTVKRLKDDLVSIPQLVIDSARGKGYILSISEVGERVRE